MTLTFIRNPSKDEYQKIEEIIALHYQAIYRYCCFHLNFDRELANDCTQDVFLTFYNSFPKIKEYAYIRAWLYRTADNYIYRYKKNAALKSKHEFSLDDASFSEPSAYDDHIERFFEDRIQVEKCLAEVFSRLSPAEQALYQSFFRDKVKLEQIADEAGISYTAATTRIYRLKRKITAIVRSIVDHSEDVRRK